MRIFLGTVALVASCLVASRGGATSDPESHSYSPLGFSKSGQHAYFEKRWSGGARDCRERWLSIYSTSRPRLVAAVPLFRAGSDCSKRALSAKAGQRVTERMYKKHGALQPGHILRPTGKHKRTLRGPKGFSLTLVVRGKFPQLSYGADWAADQKARARLRLTIVLRQGSKKLVLYRKRLRVRPVPHPGGGAVLDWPAIELTAGRLSPDGKTFALVVANKPLIVDAKK